MQWTISRTDSFVRQAAKLIKKDPVLRNAIAGALKQLQANPRHPGLRVKRVQSLPGRWEASVNMNVRIIFVFEGTTLILEAIGRHDDMLP